MTMQSSALKTPVLIHPEYTLSIGAVKVVRNPAKMICRGIGSCIALFLYDSVNKIAGGAHILMPGSCNSTEELPTSYSSNAISTLLSGMEAFGSNLKYVEAKLAGGANVFGLVQNDMGRMNTEAVIAGLKQYGIRISAMECGGSISRTISFCTRTNRVEITSAVRNSYRIKL